MMLMGPVWSGLISVGNRVFFNIPIADGIAWGIGRLGWRGERGALELVFALLICLFSVGTFSPGEDAVSISSLSLVVWF